MRYKNQEERQQGAARHRREHQEASRYTASDENRERVLREREQVTLPPIKEELENSELDSVGPALMLADDVGSSLNHRDETSPLGFDDFYYSVAPASVHQSIMQKGLIPATEELILKGATCGEINLSTRSLPNKRLLYQASCSKKIFQHDLFDSNVKNLKEAVKNLSSSTVSYTHLRAHET